MKKTKKLPIIALSLLSPALCATSVFADSINHGIVYSGGQDLGSSNVTINQELVEGLTPLISASGVTSTPNNAAKWKTAYMQDGDYGCKEYHYFEVSQDNPVVESDGLGFTITNSQFQADVQIKSVTSEDLGTKVTAVGFTPANNFIYGGWVPRSAGTAQTCGNSLEGVSPLSAKTSDDRIFVEMVVKLHKKGETKAFTSSELYFGMTDIDAAQSYKILNAGNELSSSNMIAKNAADLQPTDTTLRNKFVSSGNYIYSEYEIGADTFEIATDNISDIYVKLTDATQEDGLDIVFGFVNSAGSGIEYYSKQYTVTYKSDEHGEVTGIKDESVFAGDVPSGTEQKPAEGYTDKAWVADVDVKLANGTTIKAGDPLSLAQVKSVIVDQDITFTALHTAEEEEIAVPDTGASTKDTDAAQIATISVLAVLSGALLIRALPRILRRKVNFD